MSEAAPPAIHEYLLRRGRHGRAVSVLRTDGVAIEVFSASAPTWRPSKGSAGWDDLVGHSDTEPITAEFAAAWTNELRISRAERDAVRAGRLHDMIESPRFRAAMQYAHHAHDGQMRKGAGMPYIQHPVAVAEIVIEHGGDEDQAIAALCHDVPEDCGGQARLDEIEMLFGSRVAEIVLACTDSLAADPDAKSDWWERKVTYLAAMRTEPTDALIVSLADKNHNLTQIVRDYAEVGEALWSHFATGAAGQLWYYRQLCDVLTARRDDLAPEAQALVSDLRDRTAELGARMREQLGSEAMRVLLAKGRALAARHQPAAELGL